MSVPFGFSVGDFLTVGQLAFTLYRQCYLVARGAPQEFQSLVAELSSTSIRLLQDEVADENSALVRSGEDRLRMMKEMINRVEGTLEQLGKFSEKYAKLVDPGRSKAKKVWDRVKWSTEMADIDALRNKLVYHNGVLHLLLTSAGNSSLQRLETTTLKIERRLSSIREFIDKSQLPGSTTSPQSDPRDLQPTLSGPVTTKETKLLKFEFSAILMKNAEATSPWKAIGIKDWIDAGRWWLFKYQLQVKLDLDSGNVVSQTVYKSLIKASWILSDVITKHPQLNLLEATIQYDVQTLAEEIDEEFKSINNKKLQVPRLADLDRSELYIWEKRTMGALGNISHSPADTAATAATEALGLIDNPAFEVLLKTFGFHHKSGLGVPCVIQLFVHQHEKVVKLHMYDQSWVLQAELDVDPSTRATMYCKNGAIFVDGQWIIVGAEEAIFLHLIFAAVVEYVWWYRRSSEPKSMRGCYIRSFCMVFAVAFRYMQFVENREKINHVFRYLPELGNDHFGLVESSRTLLQRGVLLHAIQLDSKGETLLPWMTKSSDSDWLVIRLQCSKIVPVQGYSSLVNAMAKQEGLENKTMEYWKYYRKYLGSSVVPLDYDVARIVLAFMGGYLYDADAKQNLLECIGSGLKDRNLYRWVHESGVEFSLGCALIAAAACGDRRVIELLRVVEAETGITLLQGNVAGTALHEASVGGHGAIVELLMDKGADVNAEAAGRDGRTALQAAAEHGHETIVKLLMDKGADVNAKAAGSSGRTALQAAAEHGHKTIVKLLIDKDADVNAKAAETGGRTALQVAAEYGHETIVKLLMDKGANVDAEAARSKGRTALQAAAEHGHETIVKLLMDKGADVNAQAAEHSGRTALQAAAEHGHETIVKLLMDKGADVNGKAAAWSNGRTALQAATEHGHETIVKLLMDKGADVNAKAAEHSGRTALQAAAEHGHETIVKLLMDKDADVNAQAAEHSGRTALQAAAEHGHEIIVKLLMDKGADVNAGAARTAGRTALQAAAGHGHGTIVKLLMDKGADVNAWAAPYSGRTALQAAAGHGHGTIVKLLMDKGADVNAEAAKHAGRTALQAAAEHRHETIVKLLMDKGADVNAWAAPHAGRTALQAAAEHGHEAIVKLLMDKGADVNAKAARVDGRTALQVAAEHGHATIVKLLMDKGANVNARAAERGGRTALQAAAEHGHETIVKLLMDKGADVNAKAAKYGRTALQAAAENGHKTIVKLLRDKGAVR